MPYLPSTTLAMAVAPLVAGTAKVDYFPLEEVLKGAVPWVI